MEIKKIYFKSDFTLILASEAQWGGCPFRLSFFTASPSRAFVACYDGEEYHNCRLLDDGRLEIGINQKDGNIQTLMGIGLLMVAPEFYLNHDAFRDHVCNEFVKPFAPVFVDTETKKEYNVMLDLQGSSTLETIGTLPAFYMKGITDEEKAEILRQTKAAEYAAEDANRAAAYANKIAVDVEPLKEDISNKLTLVDEKLLDVDNVIEAAETAVKNAVGATSNAMSAANTANTAAKNANNATLAANAASKGAADAANTANNAASNTNAVANNIRNEFNQEKVQRAEAFAEEQSERESAFNNSENARQQVFNVKEATRDAANEAALNAAQTLKDQGEKLSELSQEVNEKHPVTEEEGFHVVDAEGQICLQYNSQGFDAAKIAEHFVQLLHEMGLGSGSGEDVRIINVKEEGFYVVDANLNVGEEFTPEGFNAAFFSSAFVKNINKASFNIDSAVQVNDGLTQTSASDIELAYDKKYGIVFLAYQGAWGAYGEQYGKLYLSYFPTCQPTNSKTIVISEAHEVGESNIISLENGCVRVFYRIGKNSGQYFYKDFDFKTQTLSEEHAVMMVLSGISVILNGENLQEHLSLSGYSCTPNEHPIMNGYINKYGNRHYGVLVGSRCYPILYYSEDNCATIVPFAIFPHLRDYEFEYVIKNGVIYSIGRDETANSIPYISYSTSSDNGVTWSTPISIANSARSRPILMEYQGKILIGYNYYNDDTDGFPPIQNGRTEMRLLYGNPPNPNNWSEIFKVHSKYGMVYYKVLDILGDLYMGFSDSQQALKFQNGESSENGKEAVRWIKLGNLLK